MPARLALVLLFVASAASAQLVQKSATFQGLPRVWFVHLPPSYDGTRPVPLVLALHGSEGSGDTFADRTGWNTQADEAGFIVVYPNAAAAVANIWNIFFIYEHPPDDVAWLTELLSRLQRDYNVDRHRVYMTGFSNGASMTTTFASVHPELLAAIAPVSGNWITAFYPPSEGAEGLLTPTLPLPVWIWRGSEENYLSGSQTRDLQDRLARDFWRRRDNATGEPATTTVGIYTTSVYSGAAEVRFTEVAGLGHDYDPNSTPLIWSQFFARLALPATHPRDARH